MCVFVCVSITMGIPIIIDTPFNYCTNNVFIKLLKLPCVSRLPSLKLLFLYIYTQQVARLIVPSSGDKICSLTWSTSINKSHTHPVI